MAENILHAVASDGIPYKSLHSSVRTLPQQGRSMYCTAFCKTLEVDPERIFLAACKEYSPHAHMAKVDWP